MNPDTTEWQQPSFFDEPRGEQVFHIAMGGRIVKRWGEVTARSYRKSGTITIDGATVRIRASGRYPFSKPMHAHLDLRVADIFDVRCDRRMVQFGLLNGPGELEPVILRAETVEDAQRIVDALPSQTTHRYATETLQTRRFVEITQARTPFAWGTGLLTFVTVFYFCAMLKAGGNLLKISNAIAIQSGSTFPPYTLAGQWWRPFTAIFVHFGIVHLAINMLTLALYGRIAERLFGSVRFVAIYLFTGYAGFLASLIFHSGSTNSAGASGAIFGVIGAFAAYSLRFRAEMPSAYFVRNLKSTVVLILCNLPHASGNVDNAAHMGGLVSGFLIAWLLAPSAAIETPSRNALRFAYAASTIGACAMITALMSGLIAVSATPKRVEERHAALFFHDIDVREINTQTHMRGLMKRPDRALCRADTATRLRSEIAPEWLALRDTVAREPQLFAASRVSAREHMVTYYNDMYRIVGDMAGLCESTVPDDMSRLRGEITALSRDATAQLLALHPKQVIRPAANISGGAVARPASS